MNFKEIFFILELFGTVAFAASGALIAIEKNTDIFGTVFLGVVSALGGGVVRDVLVGNIPPAMFSDYSYLLTAAGCSLLLFIAVYIWKNKINLHGFVTEKIIEVFDAIGLGVFTVTGINTGMACGFGGNMFFILFLGMTTGIGGGMLRDVLVKEIPFVLRKRIYAVASLLGGIVYCLLLKLNVGEILSAAAAVVLIFAVRMLSAVYKIDLPHPNIEKNK